MSSAAGGAGVGPPQVEALLAWFDRHRRPLPWRRSRDPYRIWVAEVLLQQTRVEQAAPYFERFLRRFPKVSRLARATEEEVLKAWEGAGYYGRARRLRHAAQRLVAEHGGRLPREIRTLERLPGIGPYTARAIGALAYDLPCVALEANGLRVASRWFREEREVERRVVQRQLAARLEELLPPGRAAPFNEALMELGETVCLPLRPRCPACPASDGCRAYRELADPSSLPRHRPERARPHVRASVVAVERDGRWLVQRRPSDGLLGGLWEFPGGKIEPGESPRAAALRELGEEVGVRPHGVSAAGVVRHGYSHFTVELHVFRTSFYGTVPTGRTRRWASPEELERLALPTATRKVLGVLGVVPNGAPRSLPTSPAPARRVPPPATRARAPRERPGGRPRRGRRAARRRR